MFQKAYEVNYNSYTRNALYKKDVNEYYERVDAFLNENTLSIKLDCGQEYLDKIISDTKYLLERDCFFFLYGLCDYLREQKNNISWIRLKTGINYITLSTFVVKVALFDIKEAMFFSNLHLNRFNYSLDSPLTGSDIAKNIGNALVLLDSFQIDSSFVDEYNEKKYRLDLFCRSKGVYPSYKKENNNRGCTFSFIAICLLLKILF